MTTPSLNLMSTGGIFQNSVYIGINVQNILYGIELLLYFKTIRILLTTGEAWKKSNVFYAFFTSVMLLLVTVWIAAEAVFGEKMWLINSGFPGGPNAYWETNNSDWFMDLGTTATVVLQLMTDGLMIHRCRIVWNSYRVIIVPIVLWLAALALGFLMDWITSSPGGHFLAFIASNIVLAYYAVSVFLNTTLTCMICYRILRHGKLVQEHIGYEYASVYFSIVTVVIESMLPCTLTGIACVVSFGIGSSMSVAFLCVHILMMCISPQMLILRVIVGTAWDTDASEALSSPVKFSAGLSSGSRFGTSGPRVHLQTLPTAYHPNGDIKV